MTTADLIPRPCGCVVRNRDGLLDRVCQTHIAESVKAGDRTDGVKKFGLDIPRADHDMMVMSAKKHGRPAAHEYRLAIARYVANFNSGGNE